MGEKIFCKACKFYTSELPHYMWYDDLSFRNNEKHVDCNTPVCEHSRGIKEETVITPITTYKRIEYIFDDPYVLNKNNDCPFFQKQKFWSL